MQSGLSYSNHLHSSKAIRKAQAAFTGAAEAMGISSEDDIQALVDEVRYGKER